jgi:hypothetical protein
MQFDAELWRSPRVRTRESVGHFQKHLGRGFLLPLAAVLALAPAFAPAVLSTCFRLAFGSAHDPGAALAGAPARMSRSRCPAVRPAPQKLNLEAAKIADAHAPHRRNERARLRRRARRPASQVRLFPGAARTRWGALDLLPLCFRPPVFSIWAPWAGPSSVNHATASGNDGPRRAAQLRSGVSPQGSTVTTEPWNRRTL